MKRKISLGTNFGILMAMASVGGLAGLWGAILAETPPLNQPTTIVYNDPARVAPAGFTHKRPN